MTSTALKLLALALMLLDHIHQFIPDAPQWLTWVGRIAAPLFFFCSAWGLYYTHNRKRYLVRLYVGGVCMALGNLAFARLVPGGDAPPVNNIFVTLLCVGVIVHIIQLFREGKCREAVLALALFCAAQCIGCALYTLVLTRTGDALLAAVPVALFAVGVYAEGGIVFIALGVCMFLLREDRTAFCVMYGCFCLAFFALPFLGGEADIPYSLLHDYCQWMMVAALPLMLMYNGKKGRGFKWLFYLFYPLHIWLLYGLGAWMLQ